MLDMGGVREPCDVAHVARQQLEAAAKYWANWERRGPWVAKLVKSVI